MRLGQVDDNFTESGSDNWLLRNQEIERGIARPDRTDNRLGRIHRQNGQSGVTLEEKSSRSLEATLGRMDAEQRCLGFRRHCRA
jgi:hypothetical protein